MKKRFLSLAMVLVLLPSFASCLTLGASATAGVVTAVDQPVTLATPQNVEVGTYAEYLEQYQGKAAGKSEIVIDASMATSKPAGSKDLTDYQGRSGMSIYTPEEGSVEFTFEAQEGLYNLYLEYYTESGKNVSMERALYINGKLPFDVAGNFTFTRVWQDVPAEVDAEGKTVALFPKDIYGNEVRGDQKELFQWCGSYFYDYMGYYSDPLQFYFQDGVNTLRLEGVKEPMTIGCIKLVPARENISYAEYQAQHANATVQNVDPIEVQGEAPLTKSDSTLYAYSDKSTCATEPYEQSKMLLNAIGSTRWQSLQQSLTWEIEVPETGNYYIAFKSRKNVSKGMVSARRLSIDGEVPFAEASCIPFHYSTEWVQTQLEVDGKPVTYYLEKGTHRLTLETTLGELGQQLAEVEDILSDLNTIYRRIIFVTSANPDTNRDYQLDQVMPDAIEQMAVAADRLDAVVEWIENYTGEKGGELATLTTTAVQLRRLHDNPDTIAKGLSYYQTNIGSIGTWLNSSRQIPLELDCITVSPSEESIPNPNKGFFSNLKFSVIRFIDSFVIDYNAVGTMVESKNKDEAVRVWLITGQDQFQALRAQINDQFTKNTGVEVSLELVAAGSLLPSVVANIGPDVAISQPQAEPVNFAMRNSVVDLTQFSDFKEISQRFMDEALVPFTFNGGIYALPETQTFPLLFYRTDIMQEMGITKLDTWDDIVAALSVLQKNNLQFGMPISTTADPGGGLGPFYAMLKQQGGDMYNADATACLLDSDEGIRAFKQWTNFFVNYGLDLTYDFQNRFRTGEMPLGVANYTVYNILTVAAPEIRGLWDFTLLPGTRKEDGAIDRSDIITVTSCLILASSQKQNESWEFLKWWTSADAQTTFGNELESIMGTSARYATANMEAFRRLPWSSHNIKVMDTQLEACCAVPEVPGSYFINRHLNNAFRKVVIQGGDAKENLLDYAYLINEEITSKRKEFGLSTVDKQ